MPVTAQYHGTCAECDETIAPGQRIESVVDDIDGTIWRHANCHAHADKVECACERCFLVHSGECF
jgi:hypothetical protein